MFQLDVLCFDEVFRFSRAAMRRFSEGPNRFSFIAEDEAGGMAGFVILSIHRKDDVGYIVSLDVALEHRRRGLAQQLMRCAEEHAAADPVGAVVLHVHSGNEAAVALYKRLGYRKIVLEPDFYGPGLDALMLSKPLDPTVRSS